MILYGCKGRRLFPIVSAISRCDLSRENRPLPGIQTPRAVLEWSKRVEKAGECMHPLTEYPRPAMRRDSYENLNGPWQYAITASAQRPALLIGFT